MMMSHDEMEEVKVSPSILARMRSTGNKENVPDMVYVRKDGKPDVSRDTDTRDINLSLKKYEMCN